jgi:uncharacterized protein
MTAHGHSAAGLVTSAPEITEAPQFWPTGNLWVSLPEIGLPDGSVRSLGVLLDRANGLVQAHGGADGLLRPVVTIDGVAVPLEPRWTRDGDWVPHLHQQLAGAVIDAWYLAPAGERGAAFRLRFRNTGAAAIGAELGWTGGWDSASVAQLRIKPLAGELTVGDDPWTGSRVAALSAGLPILGIALQAGDGAEVGPPASGSAARAGWLALRAGTVAAGEELTADVYVGVAPEPDGAAVTALHLRRLGFDAMLAGTLEWLAARALPVPGRQHPGLAARINSNLFFHYFFAQGDCLDTGRPVLVTSRSPHYYVCAAFWSRDAYCWTFPALLLADARRAREVLVASLAAAGPRVADHALYLNGTSLYPGFELDQAAAPILAVARYLRATGDQSVLTEAPVAAAVRGLAAMVAPWRHPEWDLYGTFLLPTDDPTDYPYVTTGNALLAAAFDAAASLAGEGTDLGLEPVLLRERASAIRAELRARLVTAGPHGPMWAWACDARGRHELRDEPPLGLRTLPFWGLCDASDPVQVATVRWLTDGYRYHYPGAFPGAGAPHFPYPSGFDLASRLLDGDTSLGDPLAALAGTPMDQGLACESWDPATGQVRTGAAMASMAGLLAWTAWTNLGHPLPAPLVRTPSS